MMSLPLLDVAIAEKIWRDACERVGAWKRGQQAREVCMGIQTIWVACEANHPDAQEFPCPPINDPAAAMAMLEWYVRQCGIRILGHGPRADQKGWTVNNEHFHARLPLAIAAAVVALPKETL